MVVDLFNTTEAQTDSLIGRTLDGRYEVTGRLGEGGVGVVYRGRQVHLGRNVAIKVLHKDAAAIPEWRVRFEREAQALSALAHPNVVPVTDSGFDKGVPFLVMELLQGKTLADLLKAGPLPLWRALDIARQTLRGLAFAHGKGIVHRDLKPANVFLQELPDQDDHVRLLDFGMVKFLEKSDAKSAETLTRAGVVFGTPAYLSPEQAKGGPADARTDVYAMGCVLFQLLAGRRPFAEDTYEGVVMAHLSQPVPLLAKVRPNLAQAAAFQPLIEKAMAKKPSARFKDADAMLTALEGVISKLPPSALSTGRRRPTPRPLRVTPAGSRLKFWRRAITLVVFAAGIAGVAYLRRDGAKPVEIAVRPKPAPKAAPVHKEPPPPPPKPAPAPEPPKAVLPTPPPLPPPNPEPVKPEPPRSEPPKSVAPTPPPTAEEPPDTEESPERKGQPRTRARNPWKEPAPTALRSIRDKLNRNVHMTQKALRPLYDYSHQNPDDPRPWLLLGRAYAQVDWYSDAVERYVRAYRVDSTCRGDPQMLPDLLKAAAHPTAGRAGARAVRDIYGAEAIPALEKEMKRRANEKPALTRLTQLRETLPH